MVPCGLYGELNSLARFSCVGPQGAGWAAAECHERLGWAWQARRKGTEAQSSLEWSPEPKLEEEALPGTSLLPALSLPAKLTTGDGGGGELGGGGGEVQVYQNSQPSQGPRLGPEHQVGTPVCRMSQNPRATLTCDVWPSTGNLAFHM